MGGIIPATGKRASFVREMSTRIARILAPDLAPSRRS